MVRAQRRLVRLSEGQNAVEIGKLSADGTDADLKALCTISVTDLQKAALKAMAEQ